MSESEAKEKICPQYKSALIMKMGDANLDWTKVISIKCDGSNCKLWQKDSTWEDENRGRCSLANR